jgi:cell division protein FtsQ
VVSTSDRRSDSSGRSKKREAVFISTTMRDRAHMRGRTSASSAAARKEPAKTTKPVSDARLRAESHKAQRESRMRAQRRATRLRVVAIVAAVVLVFGGCFAVYSSSLFTIKTVEVVGNTHITTAEVRALARVPATATLIRFPADVVAARVAASSWVATASVSRVFPSGMRIRITERVPVAIVDAGTKMWLVDDTGMVIATPTVEASNTMVVIRDVSGLDLKAGRRTTSEPLLNAITVLAGISANLATSVRSISAPTIDGTTLLRADRVEVVIGQATDLAKKSQLVQTILAQQKGKVVSIDVRVTDRATWRGLK